MAVSSRKTFGSSVLLWFRKDRAREAVRAHWRGPHAQLVARTPGFADYRQHHLAQSGDGAWPHLPGVDTTILAARRIDGFAEVVFEGLTGPLRGRKQRAAIFADEANAFARTILYVCGPGSGRVYDLAPRGGVVQRAVIFLRRRSDVPRAAFAQFVNEKLGHPIAGNPAVRELRTQLFMPWRRALWDTPDVAHDHPDAAAFHAALVIGFANSSDKDAFFHSATVRASGDAIVTHCAAVQAYDVEFTHIYVRDVRITLPQVGPVAKPPIDPVRRKLAPPPARARRADSISSFPRARTIALSGPGAEDVVVDAERRLICGLADGRIVRLQTATGFEETIGNTNGRPLGLEVLHDGRILICDARKGLLRLDPMTARIEALVAHFEGVPLRFCSNVVATSDGSYWFTESTSRFDFEHYLGALLEQRPSGRLFRCTPDGKVDVVVDGLHFPNGLTLVERGTALVFAETGGYRLTKFELIGAHAGRASVIADNLPGFPDNLSAFRDGKFWVAMVSPRNAALDRSGTWPGAVRRWAWSRSRMGAPTNGMTWAMAFDADGNLVSDLQAERSDFFGATGVAQIDDRLYLSGVNGSALLEIEAP